MSAIVGDGLGAIIPQKDGVHALEHYTCERHAGEPWRAHVPCSQRRLVSASVHLEADSTTPRDERVKPLKIEVEE